MKVRHFHICLFLGFHSTQTLKMYIFQLAVAGDFHIVYYKLSSIFHMRGASEGHHTTVWGEVDRLGFILLLGTA